MQDYKQKKKPYVPPKCEVYGIGKCNLMDISAGVNGFEEGDLDDDRKYGIKETENLQN